MNWSLDKFSEQFWRATDLDDQIEVLLKAIGSFGYDTYLFGLVPKTTASRSRDFIMISNYDPEWLSEYSREEMFTHDRTISMALLSQDPILWSSLRTPEERSIMTPEEIHVHERATAWGYGTGVSIPLWLPNSTVRYGMSFSRRGLTDAKKHDAMFREHQQTLVSIAKLFFLGVDISGKIYSHYKLTDLELQIIALLANGRKVKEIAYALNKDQTRNSGQSYREPLSESALHQRITKIWKKVGTNNTNHLVAAFSQLGVTPEVNQSLPFVD